MLQFASAQRSFYSLVSSFYLASAHVRTCEKRDRETYIYIKAKGKFGGHLNIINNSFYPLQT